VSIVAATALPGVPPVSAAYNLIAWVGAGVVLALLGRVLHDRSFRYLAATLVLFAASRFVSSIPPGPAVLVLIVNLLVIASACVEVCFFRTVLDVDTGAARPPQLRNEVLTATVVALIGTTAWLRAPESARSGALAGTGYAHNPAAFIFVTVIIGYYITVSFRVLSWTRQLGTIWVAARTNPEGQTRAPGVSVARLGFQIGVTIIGLAELVRFIADVVKFGNEITAIIAPAGLSATQALSPIIEACIRTGHTAFYIGALLPLLAGATASVPILLTQARDYRISGPLWNAITAEFPDLAFHHTRGISSRLYRREIEIRDGLVLLGPYYNRDLAHRVNNTAAGPTPDPDLAVTVALIRAALRAHRAGQATANPHPLPTSGTATRADDLKWLLRVAAAFADAEKTQAPLVRTQP